MTEHELPPPEILRCASGRRLGSWPFGGAVSGPRPHFARGGFLARRGPTPTSGRRDSRTDGRRRDAGTRRRRPLEGRLGPTRARDERGRPRRRGPASLGTRNQRSRFAGLRGFPPARSTCWTAKPSARSTKPAPWPNTWPGSPERRVFVVTNEFHTRRARWTFDRVLGSRAGRSRSSRSPSDDFRTDAWWRDEIGFSIIFGEFLKLGFYSFRYGHLGHATAGLGRAAGGLGGVSPPAPGRQRDRVESIIGIWILLNFPRECECGSASLL